MDTKARSQWHVGGTSAPDRWKQKGGATRFPIRRIAEAVPHRATSNVVDPTEAPEFRRSQGPRSCSGTQWHGGLKQSIGVHGRTP